MDGSRLDLIAPDLAEILPHATSAQLRDIALAACTIALDRTGLAEPLLERALVQLRHHRAGDVDLRRAIHDLVQQLDRTQWQIQAAVEAGNAPEAAYEAAFAEARAAHAVWYALDPDPVTAALESLYEAGAATDDPDALRSASLSVLGQPA